MFKNVHVFKCKFLGCNKEYTSQNSLRRHNLKKHSDWIKILNNHNNTIKKIIPMIYLNPKEQGQKKRREKLLEYSLECISKEKTERVFDQQSRVYTQNNYEDNARLLFLLESEFLSD